MRFMKKKDNLIGFKSNEEHIEHHGLNDKKQDIYPGDNVDSW